MKKFWVKVLSVVLIVVLCAGCGKSNSISQDVAENKPVQQKESAEITARDDLLNYGASGAEEALNVALRDVPALFNSAGSNAEIGAVIKVEIIPRLDTAINKLNNITTYTEEVKELKEMLLNGLELYRGGLSETYDMLAGTLAPSEEVGTDKVEQASEIFQEYSDKYKQAMLDAGIEFSQVD